MKKHISALIFLFILYSVPTALAQSTAQLSSREQVNGTLQTFLSSVKTNMKLQDFIYPDGALIDEKRRAPSADEVYDYYTYDLGGCFVTVSAFLESVRGIAIPIEDNACVFDIAPFAEIPVNNTVLTSELTFSSIQESIIDGSKYNYDPPVEEKADKFWFINYWRQDFIGVLVTAQYEVDRNSKIGQSYLSYKEEIANLIDWEQIVQLRKSFFNHFLADQKITIITIHTIGLGCGVAMEGLRQERARYYRTHGIDLKD